MAEEQRNLFWLGDPQLVVTMIQFMQFGYAIALSVVLIYWGDMQKDDDFSAIWYLLSSVLCYIAFVCVMARVVPRYTLCTNLGQLVDKKLLHETVARHKLKEAERYRQRQEYLDDLDDDECGESITTGKDVLLLGTDANSNDSHVTAVTTAITPSTSAADLQLPNSITEAEEIQQQRRKRNRQKTRSEGVWLMRKMDSVDENGGYASADDETPAIHARQQRKKSTSTGVVGMHDESSRSTYNQQSDRDTLLANFVKMDLQSAKATLARESDAMRRSTTSRSGRSRSNSAGSLIQQMKSATAVATSKMLETVPGTAGLINALDMGNDDNSVALSEVDENDIVKVNRDEKPRDPFSLNKTLAHFFTSPRYRLTSHVFGTLICFFLVAMRVEGFLQKQCIVPEDDYSWDLPLQWSFLLELIWLCVALATALVVLITFSSKKDMNRTEYKAVIAALLNVAIVSSCLGLLLGAESQRCCSDSAGYDQNSYNDTGGESDLFDQGRFLQYDDEKKACTDATLECTCSEFGHRVHGSLGTIEPWTALIALQAFRFILANKLVKCFNLGVKKYQKKHHDHGHDHGHGSGVNKLEIIAHAWQEAVAKHPDLVEKYGEFSGELLQAMLELDVVERRKGQMSAPLLGPTVSNRNRQLTLSATPNEIDIGEQFDLCTYPFDFPNAKIIRSIRRCDRMYLPLLKKWTTVDVILTKHEMVYLDVCDHDESLQSEKTIAMNLKQLIETKGGRGLRLCDVTAGRRVLGHLNFADIVKVGVEREMPTRAKSKATEDLEASELHLVRELWQPSNGVPFDQSVFVCRWEEAQQDRLRIDTHRGTLYLRFYADLLDVENHPEWAGDETELHKDHAFNWAQTLVHICVDQLKQPLPHFGDGDEEELRDYLQIVSC